MKKALQRVELMMLLSLLMSAPALASESEQCRACLDKAQTQTDMTDCARDELSRVEAQLKSTYRKLLSAAAGEPRAVAKIKKAEKSWIDYRDKCIEAMFPADNKQAEYGSIFPMEANLYLTSLTQQHISALEDMLARYARH